jgi:hypothetical protein
LPGKRINIYFRIKSSQTETNQNGTTKEKGLFHNLYPSFLLVTYKKKQDVFLDHKTYQFVKYFPENRVLNSDSASGKGQFATSFSLSEELFICSFPKTV